MLTLITRLCAGFGLLLLAVLGAIALVWISGWAAWMFGLVDDANLYLDALWTFMVDLGGWKRVAIVAGGSAVGAVLFDGMDATDLAAVGTRSDGEQAEGIGSDL